jgi:hypothetical protein
MTQELKRIFEKLWSDYTSQNPSALQVFNILQSEGETVLNDHIAFRTFNDPRIGVDRFAKVFLDNGYEFKGDYRFESKKLYAKHFEHPEDGMPRIFISELILEQCSSELQEVIRPLIDQIPHEWLESSELGFAGRLWEMPGYPVYEMLRNESEYAAWVYVNGFAVNHFTVNVNRLKSFPEVKDVNNFLRSKGFLINEAGGEVKGTPAELLEQSSTMAGLVTFTFREGLFEIPGCYYEFAKRYPDNDGKLYSGFIAKSADKIFESTDFYKKP